MAVPADHFDLYVSAKNSTPEARAELTRKLQPRFPLDALEVAAFVATGARLRLKRNIDQGSAMKALLELQAIGAAAEIEPSARPVIAAPPPPPAAPAPAFSLPADLADRLAGVDGSEVAVDVSEDPVRAPSPRHPPPIAEVAPQPVAPPPLPQIADLAPEPVAAPAINRFAPAADREAGIDLDLPARGAKDQPPPEEAEAPRCKKHDEFLPCEKCAEAALVIPGRIRQGALRQTPVLRLAIGLVMGLLAGYLASMPYANRAERRVAEVRAEANVDRYKNDPALKRASQMLDAKADEMASSAFIGMVAIWLVLAAAVTGIWYRLT